jgi:competence protein ComEC
MASHLHRIGHALALAMVAFLAACSEAERPKTAAVKAAPTIAADALSGDVMRVHYIDVGQGNAALVEFKCAAILIDAGGEEQSPPKLTTYLEDFFARRPDLNRTLAAIYITHTHVDHNVSLRRVVERYTVHNYIHTGLVDPPHSGWRNATWMRDHANDNGRHTVLRTVTHDDVARISDRSGVSDDVIDPVKCAGGDPRIRIVHGPRAQNPGWSKDDYEDANNGSLIVRIDYGKASFLFLGDIETAAIETLVKFYEGTATLATDVFLASHHGSKNGTTASLMKALSPQIGVISVGHPDRKEQWTAWDHGHPNRTAVDLMAAGIKRSRPTPRSVLVASRQNSDYFAIPMDKALYATGWEGTVIVTADRSGRISIANDDQPIAMAAK